MWATCDIRYGGLNLRYKSKSGRLVRHIDPFTSLPVEFSTTLRADNWLLRNFCPGVVQCDVQPGKIGLVEHGVIRWVKCDTVTTFNDGVRIADLVISVMTSKAEESWKTFQKAAAQHRYAPKLRTRDEIRVNTTLLANLDMMRQHLILHSDQRISEVQKKVYMCIAQHKRSLTPVEIGKALAWQQLSKERIDSALFLIYRKGLISINIAEFSYGSDSRIALA